MRDIIPAVDRWREEGEQIALATVVETWGSAPRRVGAHMAMTSSGEIAGSVSGGCVEGAVVEAGQKALQLQRPELLHFGVADETAWDVGLACGGSIEVFVEPLDPDHYAFLHSLLDEEKSAVSAIVVQGPEAILGRRVSLGRETDLEPLFGLEDALAETALEAARGALAEGISRRTSLGSDPVSGDEVEAFINVLPPSHRLVMVGGVHIAVALAELAKPMGYRTVVIDPRRAFGSETRFPHVDELIQSWPDEAFESVDLNASTAVVMLTHDPKIDDPALIKSLRSDAFYVGALGSQRTQAKRRDRLQAAGLSVEELARLHGPVGLDLGGETPEEIALAVMAQIVAVRHGRSA